MKRMKNCRTNAAPRRKAAEEEVEKWLWERWIARRYVRINLNGLYSQSHSSPHSYKPMTISQRLWWRLGGTELAYYKYGK